MTHQPPLPAASTPPYPLHPAAHEEPREQPIEGTPAEVVEVREPSATREVLMKRVGIGAAVGIGSAAIAAALLYVRGGAKGASGKDAKRGEKSKRTSDDTTKRGKADRDHRAEPGHAVCQPWRHASAVQRQIGAARPLRHQRGPF